ncbi:hypothetical protein C1H46_002799 [Malus baccata]|uniref:Uncharacterized protein n=1 Tax=Malus baccata TaxID=106549 RepID=A0A540NKM7_MALBA|nr:hypothetical protein C1H46_002799 [Malus baccata]
MKEAGFFGHIDIKLILIGLGTAVKIGEFNLEAVPSSSESMVIIDRLQQLNSCHIYLFFRFNVGDQSLEKCGMFPSHEAWRLIM